ncbi:glycoside hydrolase family 32 protein [Vibrio gazogenes]|uniref:Sucrose-6-phosphate hydrolase n=1 Tax=Vibrio gazogenes TaxID=687 RepID=A0A1Z2SC70_VIBGA|nr:glycoside hydrolase family 32 protein [Vibrio gazogenes]ASA54776.1 sucrose-6-phosphate hydrolase [Vibrio gazogenes]
MCLEDLIELAGGVSNIYRVLLPEHHVSLAVRNPDVIQNLPADVVLEEVLGEWHLTDLSDETVNEDALFRLGRAIEAQQRTQLSDLAQPVACHYRPSWHIAPPRGLLNDPNGFIFHEGQYHLFYQWSPVGCAHTDKYWVHTLSDDLLNWRWNDVALTPSDWFDSHGVYSGHAVSLDKALMVFYTGNVRLGQERSRQTMQCAAISQAGEPLHKIGPVIRELPPGVTEHTRDPKVIYRNGKWMMFLGTQTTAMQGRLAVYHSVDLRHWQFDNLYGHELGDFGYMWECPDIFNVNGQDCFVFAPQGIQSESELNTVPHQNRIAQVSFNAQDEISISKLQVLDHGFDFYAPQSMETPDGRRVMCGWMGLPDELKHPTCRSGWIHQLTALRELEFVGGKIVQHPLRELAALRGELHDICLENDAVDLNTKTFELFVELEWGSRLRLFEDEQYYIEIYLDPIKHRLLLDRTHTQIEEGDTVREVELSSGSVALQILADNSSLEIFINHGEAVMTTRVFTPESATRLSVKDATVNLQVYELQAPVTPYRS